jgi:glucose-6-phosphate dehydrogenase assembly protein OpcA
MDQYPAKIKSARVAAEAVNPSAELLQAWLSYRLKIPVERIRSRGPGITSVQLTTGGGDISIDRPDGLLAQFTLPNSPARPVALKRRERAELLAEELRRLDPDDTYANTVRELCRLASQEDASGRRTSSGASNAKSAGKKSAQPTRKSSASRTSSSKATARKGSGSRTSS